MAENQTTAKAERTGIKKAKARRTRILHMAVSRTPCGSSACGCHAGLPFFCRGSFLALGAIRAWAEEGGQSLAVPRVGCLNFTVRCEGVNPWVLWREAALWIRGKTPDVPLNLELEPQQSESLTVKHTILLKL